MKIAAAPISWGVCEVPGWGYQLDPARVLGEIAGLGLTATELGPDGFLPAEPAARAALLSRYGLRAVGGFVPVVLHDPAHDPLPALRATVASFEPGAVAVLAAATGVDGYDARPELDRAGWDTLLANLDRAARGLDRPVVLHPHVGTMVESADEVARVLDGSEAQLCLDTGHLLVGGADPVAIAADAPDRIAHVHLKDVDAAMATRVRAGELTYTQAVAAGLYRPLGHGDVNVKAIVTGLEAAGYTGWYVMEQDVVLAGEPGPGAGPVADVRESLDFLRRLA
ncbi:TIM barrel protein [Nonomuraea sp. NPDC050328]|uniref:TIM barrel protein n=1 Tax=Nonomuraea sp. NPDC050328 TaxID=3364361 RepID=UPI0037BBB4C5